MNDRDTPDALKDRWKIALHEAGHVAGNAARGGRPGMAFVFKRCGTAYPDHLSATSRAIMIACGPAAGEYAETLAPPPPPPASAEAETRSRLGETLDHVEADHREALTDERVIALWAITGHEDDPGAWADRVAWLRLRAETICHEYRDRIVALARRLYETGHVGREELEAMGFAPDPPLDPEDFYAEYGIRPAQPRAGATRRHDAAEQGEKPR